MPRWLTLFSLVLTKVGVLPMIARTLAFAVIFGLSVPAQAADHPVNSEADLRTAITSAVDGDTITFNVDVTLTQDLPAIQTNVSVVGNSRVLDGAGTYRGFFVVRFVGELNAAVAVTIQDLTIQHARSRGGAGRDNAGGGAGLGGALFVANRATVTLSNVQLDANSAIGGLGGVNGVYGGGGGGGLGGFGGLGTGGGGGGAGAGASGGDGGFGEDGSEGIMVGLASGGNGAGSGPGSGGPNGGGGGAAGGTSAGAGGGGVGGFPGSSGGSGGRGGFGGGGGGAGNVSSIGGMGGYGGGGGASGMAGGSLTGLGGFGGGGAGGATGGFGGGNGAVSIGFPGGGGGAGLGGALFVQEGGSLTLAGPLTINGSIVTGGAALDGGATSGSAFGSGIFLQGAGLPLTCAPGAGETQTIADDIVDQSVGGDSRTRGLTKSGAGTLTLAGVNTYSGATTVNAGTLLINSPGSIASPVTVNIGGTLGGTGTVGNAVTVNSGGTIVPGTSLGILNTGTLTLTAGSTLAVEINGTTPGTQYDQVNVTGGVILGNATLSVVLGFTPSAGQTFTIIANDLTDAVVGTFAGLPEGSIFTTGAGRFRISYVGGSGNDVTLTAIGPPTIAKAFGSLAISLNDTTTLTFTLTNPNAGTALTGVGLTDSLLSGLTVVNGADSDVRGDADDQRGQHDRARGGHDRGEWNLHVFSDGDRYDRRPQGQHHERRDLDRGWDGRERRGVPGGRRAAASGCAADDRQVVRGGEHHHERIHDADEIALTNPNMEVALNGVGFTDTLPTGLVVATPNGLTNSCGGTVTATAGTGSVGLASGALAASGSCTVTVNVTGTTGGTKVNTTDFVTSTEGGTGGTASASLTVIAPPTIAKAFGAATIIVNGTTTLTFTLTNPNTGTALNGVGFTDTLPAGLTVANGATSTCGGTLTTSGGNTIALAGATIAASGSCIFPVTVTGTTAGAKNNTTGAVTSTEGGTGLTASANVTVVAPPTIAKAFGAASIIINGTTTLTFTVTNPNGGTALTGLGFTDALPAGLVVTNPNALANTCGGTVTADAGTAGGALVNGGLPANASCTVTVNVTGTTSGAKNNTTGAVTSTEGGTGLTASASITVVAPPTIAKALGAANIGLNETTALTFTLTNPNAATALTGVAFTDPLPAGLVVATPNGLTGACGGGTITAFAGTTTLDLAGATLAAGTSCVFAIDVLAVATGDQVNTTSAVTSANGGTGNAATASLTVGVPVQIPTLSTFALAVLAIVVLLGGLRRKRAT